MNARAFFDTNILIYLYADKERDKQEISEKLVNEAETCVISTQVINELNNVMIKKWQLPHEAVKRVQEDIRLICELHYINENVIDEAIALNARYGFSYYDCLMLASALEGSCDVIYTEDMKHGQVINGRLKIINPFDQDL